jgi:hypothetical protein
VPSLYVLLQRLEERWTKRKAKPVASGPQSGVPLTGG